MSVISIVKLVILFVFCIYASADDIVRGIVSNKVVMGVGSTGLLICVLEMVLCPDRIRSQLLAFSAASLIAVGLYILRIWAGGDSKMMLAVALLMPYEVYMNTFNGIVPSLIVLSFAFAFGYLYLIVDSLWSLFKSKSLFDKERNNQLRARLLSMMLNWFICTIHISLINYVIALLFHPAFAGQKVVMMLINYLLAVLIYEIKALRHPISVVIAILILIALNVYFDIDINIRFRLITLAVVLVSLSIKMFVDGYNYKTISVSDLEKGMILSLPTTMTFSESRVSGLPDLSTEDLKSRLTEDEVNAVKKWCKKAKQDSVVVVRKIPFAIFISLGAVSYLLGGLFI